MESSRNENGKKNVYQAVQGNSYTCDRFRRIQTAEADRVEDKKQFAFSNFDSFLNCRYLLIKVFRMTKW